MTYLLLAATGALLIYMLRGRTIGRMAGVVFLAACTACVLELVRPWRPFTLARAFTRGPRLCILPR